MIFVSGGDEKLHREICEVFSFHKNIIRTKLKSQSIKHIRLLNDGNIKVAPCR